MSDPAERHSEAADRYEENSRRFMMLLKAVNSAWTPVTERMEALRPQLDDAEPGDDVDRALDDVIAQGEEVSALVGFAFQWYVVMFVTFAEAYLEDVLAASARLDASVMQRSDQRASYEDVQAASSIAELESALRHRWARNFVDDGGPTRWVERLTKMGARYSNLLSVEILEEAWGVRHCVVHRAGVVDLEFQRRHPQMGHVVGTRLEFGKATVIQYSATIQRFVADTDAFFTKRYPGLSVAG